ncbi:MAG: hypothetical protein ACFB10_05500 [Salibacteraceae bacterium]
MANRIDDLHFDASGNVYLTSDFRFYRRLDDQWSVFSEFFNGLPPQAQFTAINDAGTNNTWFFANQLLFQLTDRNLNLFTPPDNAQASYSSIAFDNSGNPYFSYWNRLTPATLRLEIGWYQGGEFNIEQAPNLFTGTTDLPSITNIVEDGDGGFWITGNEFLYHFIDGTWTSISHPNFTQLLEITRSPNGVLWISEGANTIAVHRYANGTVTSYPSDQCLGNIVSNINADDQDRMWFYNNQRELQMFDGTQCNRYSFSGFAAFTDLALRQGQPHVSTSGGVYWFNEVTNQFLPFLGPQ